MSSLRCRIADRIVPVANRLRFAVGRDAVGHWVALELQGRGGGFFRSKEAALHYAMAECGGRRRAVRVSRRPLPFPL